MKSVFDSQSLFMQMVISFVAIVFLTSAAVGIPAIWLLQNQLDRQAWAQIEQGQRVTRSLYDFYSSEIQNLATLTAQRPTLQELLIQKDAAGLSDYLTTLESGAGLDRIVVCDSENHLVAATQSGLSSAICSQWRTGKFHYDPPTQTVCLIASHPIEHDGGLLGDVFVCSLLDQRFSAQLFEQTGLDHLVWMNDLLITSSLENFPEQIESFFADEAAGLEDLSSRTLEINGTSYYAAAFPLDGEELISEVLLDVSGLVQTRARLIGILAASILGVSLVGSILGVLLVQRINRPLVQLSRAASGFSIGDLESPVHVETHLREINQVAQTLENARLDLLATLTNLESERDWSEHLLASIVEGIVTIDNQQHITFFSRGAERIMGQTAAHAIGRKIDAVFVSPDGQTEFHHYLPAVLESRQNIDLICADQRVASLAVTAVQIARPGEKTGETVLVFRDISKEEAVHRLLGQFLASTAHEFRTPLAALEASVELLLDQAPDLSKQELLELHTSLHLGVLGLHTLVDNLLESANIEARRFTVSPRACGLQEIISEAVQTMQPLLTKYDQRLTIEIPAAELTVRADPRRTLQVMINLLSNASRHGPPNEEIGIRVSRQEHFARVEVIDCGPGIPPEDRVNLFRRFVFPRSASAAPPAGAGLGLSVVEAIVTAQGGKTGVDDRTGPGSVFWFTVPLDKEQT